MKQKHKENINLITDFDKNFSEAYKLCETSFSHAKMIDMLSSGNIQEKQIAALKFDYVQDNYDVKILLNNLTGCDGKIREAVAFKIKSLISENHQAAELFSKQSAEIFADATIDINANICRYIVDSAILLKSYTDFSSKYTEKILRFSQQALDELDKFIFKDKKYIINKQLFKLYWCLEALSFFYDYADKKTLTDIVLRCLKQKEYTIREKIAQLIKSDDKFNSIQITLENDENYYVRQALLYH